MTKYSLTGSRVLISANYTEKELMAKYDKKNKKNKKNKKTIAEPPSFLFEVRNVQVQPHRPSYEEFKSAYGLIMVEKNCDEFTNIQMDILVHQNLSNTKRKAESRQRNKRNKVTGNR